DRVLSGWWRAACRAGRAAALDRLDVDRLGALLPLAGLVLDPRVLAQGLEARACDVRVVHGQILAAILRRDEAVALRVVEPLHGSGCHKKPLPPLLTNA